MITALLPFIAVTCLVGFHYLLSFDQWIMVVMCFQICLWIFTIYMAYFTKVYTTHDCLLIHIVIICFFTQSMIQWFDCSPNSLILLTVKTFITSILITLLCSCESMEISAQETEDSSPCSACDKCDGVEPKSVSKPTSWSNYQISPFPLWMDVVAFILKHLFTMVS